MRYELRAVSWTIGVAFLAGCGGGGGGGSGGPAPIPVTVPLSSEAALDGSIIDGILAAGDPSVFAGDQDRNVSGVSVSVPMRAFWSFDLSTLPAGATIVSATFSVNQIAAAGAPYAELGVLGLDHLDYGATFESADYGIASIAPLFATLSSDAALVTKTVDVTARVQADRTAARTRTQFRARFTLLDSNLDDTADHAELTCSESAAGNPVLTVTYTP